MWPRTAMALLILTGCRTPEPPEPTTWSASYFIDPQGGDDAADGRTEATALRSFARFEATGAARLSMQPNTRVALRRGSVLRLTGTVQLHGNDSGWVAYSAYGDPALPRPLLLGSVPLRAADWSAPDPDGVRTADWSPFLDGTGGRSLSGVEQGPGNLWFFESEAPDARMTSWGWRKQADVGVASVPGDWHYDPSARTVRLKWPGPAPAFTEAAVNRLMLDPSGQRHLILEELDLRYGGTYGVRGHSLEHLHVRGVDFSFLGGGTKNQLAGVDQYVREGNALEIFGDGSDVVIEGCRARQLFDTGFDPQYVGGSSVTMDGFTVRDSLISYTSLAGLELWERPDAPAESALRHVTIEDNTLLSVGRGWGYEQHDHPGVAKIGAAFLTITSRGQASEVSIRHNVVVAPRAVLVSDWRDADTRAFFGAFEVDENLWDLSGGGQGAVLYQGASGSIEADLGTSLVYADLPAWQGSTALPGRDAASLSGEPRFAAPVDPLTEDLAWIQGLPAGDPSRPTRLGAFALRGDYRRPAATLGVGWGAALAP